MRELFEAQDVESTPVVQDHAGTGKTCGKCMHAVSPHYYRDWMYCELRPCRRTQFGIKRVRSRLPACEWFSNRHCLPNDEAQIRAVANNLECLVGRSATTGETE